LTRTFDYTERAINLSHCLLGDTWIQMTLKPTKADDCPEIQGVHQLLFLCKHIVKEPHEMGKIDV